MKKFIIDCIIVPTLMVGPFLLLGFIIYDTYQQEKSLKFACETLGGVYIDPKICISGKNLFVEK
jgi:hypothetical protein